jgi:hypothetical protein
MHDSLHKMEVALRVLSSLTNGEKPDPDDVRELVTLAHTAREYSLDSLDELACEVIQQALRRRAEVRRQTAGS